MAKNRVIPFGYCMKNGVITTDPKEVLHTTQILLTKRKNGLWQEFLPTKEFQAPRQKSVPSLTA